MIANDHWLSAMMPDAFHGAAGGTKTVHLADLEQLVLDAMLIDADVAKKGIHFVVLPARYKQLLVDVGSTGNMDWSPISGELYEALPTAKARLVPVIKSLTDEKRAISASDVIYDGPAEDAGTTTWYDWITPAVLMASGGGTAALAQFRAITRNGFCKEDEGGRNDDDFADLIGQIGGSVGRDISAISEAGQAAAVAAWIRKTQPPSNFIVHIADPTVEVERRAAESIAERFEPLFVVGWRSAYPALSDLWPQEVTDVATTTAALASCLGVSGLDGGVTPQGMSALVTVLNEYKAFAADSENSTRTTEVVRAFKQAASGQKEEMSPDAKAELQSDADFQKFKKEVEACGDDNYVSMAEAMLKAEHGAGLLFLNGKFAHDKFWKERMGARTNAAIASCFNKKVSINTASEAMEWGAILPEDTPKKLTAGKFTLNWWTAFKPVIAKREGTHVAARIDKRLHSKPAGAVFSDSEALRLLEIPVRACMSLIIPGKDQHSFPALWRMLMRMAASVHNMPATCLPAAGIKGRLEEAAMQAMRCPQDRFEAMLATPVTAVHRIRDFVIDGQARNALDAVDKTIARLQQEVEDGMHGHAHDVANNWYANGGGDWSTQPNGKRQRPDYDDHLGGGGDAKPPKQSSWGAIAQQKGILANADHTRIAFGDWVVQCGSPADCKEYCVAAYAPSKKTEERNKWCISPAKCWSAWGPQAHARPNGLPDELPREAFEEKDRAELTVVIARAQDAGAGRGGGGKGGGKGAGKGGRGKGHGQGKGGKGKGGKGKGGGKGAQNFARQS